MNLPRRDYFLIPLLSLMTMLVMFGSAEVASRIKYPEKDYDECRVAGADDPRRAKPNCTVSAKVPEGPWVRYAMNECGYRTPDHCGPKPPGVLRIALMGASMTMAKNVPLEETWGERTRRAISRAAGRKVEIENLGWELLNPLNCYRQLDQVIALKPDAVIYAVNPFDLSRDTDPLQIAHRNDPVLPPHAPPPAPLAQGKAIVLRNAAKAVQNLLNESRTFTMAQHFLFSNPDTFLKIYLADGDRADYLRLPFTPAWKTRFAAFNLILTDMAARLHQAGIPFIVMSLPARAQVILVAKGQPYPPGTDPFAFDREIQSFCDRNAVPYLPALKAFSQTPNGDKLFYIVDTHITGEGDAVIARLLVPELLNEPAFRSANKSH
jgi:hypothetical protein